MELTFDSTHFLNPRKIHSRRHKNLRGRWPREMVRIRPDASSNRSVSFGINEVDNGRIFKWLAERAVEAEEEDAAAVQQKHRALKSEYWDDALILSGRGGGKGRGGGRGLGGRGLGPPKRPPIRHVIMAYGVDLPTDIGYGFVHVNASGRGGLLLEESVEETAGGAVWAVRHRDGLSLSEAGAGGGGGGGRDEERDGRDAGEAVVAAVVKERKRIEKERKRREKERKKQELQVIFESRTSVTEWALLHHPTPIAHGPPPAIHRPPSTIRHPPRTAHRLPPTARRPPPTAHHPR